MGFIIWSAAISVLFYHIGYNNGRMDIIEEMDEDDRPPAIVEK